MTEPYWKINGIFKADPQKVCEEIGYKETTPEEVLNKARNEESELHKCFEWNDEIAGEKWRLQQARQVLNMLVFRPKERPDTPVRVFSYTKETNYKPTIQMVVNLDEYQELLKRAKFELQAFKNKYKTLSELKGIFDLIEEL